MATPRDRERATLLDRVALAFLSGVSTLLFAGLLWAGFWILVAQVAPDWKLSFGWVIGAAAIMAVLGFVLLENFVGNWVGGLLRWVLNLLRALVP